jgi:hypothetical protein
MRTIKNSKPANDPVNPSCIKLVSMQQIQAVTKFLPIFENMNPDEFAHIIPHPDSTEDCHVVGHLEYHRTVYEFMKACYENGFVQSFDWPAWGREARRYMGDRALVRSARLATCIKLITAHLRDERFCDGHLQDVLMSGHITGILRRLEQLASAR